MVDWPLMLWVNLPLDDTSHSKVNKFVMGAKIKVSGDSKLNDCPVSGTRVMLVFCSNSMKMNFGKNTAGKQ